MRRRLALSLVLLGLTATLVAQTRQSMPLTRPDAFGAKVSFATRQQDGDKLRLTDVSIEFATGITITADEVVFDKAKEDKAKGVVQLSGNVQLLLMKK